MLRVYEVRVKQYVAGMSLLWESVYCTYLWKNEGYVREEFCVDAGVFVKSVRLC